MTSPDDDKSPYDQILDAAEGILGTRTVEILQFVDICWKTDGIAALVRAPDGRTEIVIPDVGPGEDPLDLVLSSRVSNYRRLWKKTEYLLEEYWRSQPAAGAAAQEFRRKQYPAPPRIVRTPGVMSGDLVVKGTRVRPQSVLLEILDGRSEPEIRDTYPSVPKGVVNAVLNWADEIISAELRRQNALDWDGEPLLDAVNVTTEAPPSSLVADERNSEQLAVFGSGNVAEDLGLPDPEETALRWRLCSAIKQHTKRKQLTPGEILERTGIDPGVLDLVWRGGRGITVFQLMRLLSKLGNSIIIGVDDLGGEGGIFVQTDTNDGEA